VEGKENARSPCDLKVGDQPQQLPESSLTSEELLEKMIVASDARILSDDWMLIGEQEDTGHGPIDLLALTLDASLVLIELKKGRTPREVMAQALEYTASIENLQLEDIAAIYGHFKPSRSLADDFRTRFGQPLDEDALNQSHQIVIVASALNDRTERIVGYLSKRDIPINVLFFQVFAYGTEQLLSRTWLLDPARTPPEPPPDDSNASWNGEFYACFGHGERRSWAEAVQYGFLSAGGGKRYTDPLRLLKPDDRVWIKAPGYGFVGVGKVAGNPERASLFRVETPQGEMPALEVLKQGNYHRDFVDDPERSEYFVPMRWLDTVPVEKAIKEPGLFGIPGIVARPKSAKWQYTVARLKEEFPKFDS
jgi:hypothetical protein